MQALCLFQLLFEGFRNADLRNLVAQLSNQDPATLKPGRMTYDRQDAYDCTGSSNDSRVPTATASPPKEFVSVCFIYEPKNASFALHWPSI
ncbi:MAG: hypothetical protein ACRER2_19190, partial [Methylococcales bacterium]